MDDAIMLATAKSMPNEEHIIKTCEAIEKYRTDQNIDNNLNLQRHLIMFAVKLSTEKKEIPEIIKDWEEKSKILQHFSNTRL